VAPEIAGFWAGFWFVVVMGFFALFNRRGETGIPLYRRLWYRFVWFEDEVMSNDDALDASEIPSDTTTSTSDNQGGNRIAMPGKAVNSELPDNAAAMEQASFAARVDAVIAVLGTGKIGQTEAIERIFNCSRSSRSTSIYAQARAAVQARMAMHKPAYPPLSPEQQATRDWIEGRGSVPEHLG
jgi:hypothetical protein